MKLHHFRYNRLLRWLFRFRKRCGYGIHSPFAYNLVTGVIYEDGQYYAYDELTKLASHHTSDLRLKDNRLLFRLVNNAQPKSGIIISPSLDLSEYYLRYGKRACNWTTCYDLPISQLLEHLASLPSADFIYLDAAQFTTYIWQHICSTISPNGLIVIRGIHQDAHIFDLWTECIQDESVRVTFDLYDFALVFFEERLNKENYIINYF